MSLLQVFEDLSTPIENIYVAFDIYLTRGKDLSRTGVTKCG